MNNISYTDFEKLLNQHDADVDCAEAHGIATGMLCLDERITSAGWMQELFQIQPEFADHEIKLLQQLFEQARSDLRSDSFEFDLFLPEDDAQLSEQLEALRNWCLGFLFGLGYAQSGANWPGDSGEILKDVVEFTKLDSNAQSEEDEQAMVEIQEYLRAAVLLLRDDLRGNTAELH